MLSRLPAGPSRDDRDDDATDDHSRAQGEALDLKPVANDDPATDAAILADDAAVMSKLPQLPKRKHVAIVLGWLEQLRTA